jgi:type 1 glutamine amidotransferase
MNLSTGKLRLHCLAAVASVLVLGPGPAWAEIPYVDKLAPGVYAAGFGHKYADANCGWVVLSDHTLLINLPRGLPVPQFVADVNKIAGKPLKSVILTQATDGDAEILDALRQQGVTLIPSPSTKTSIEGAKAKIQFIPYGTIAGQEGAAIYLASKKVLFAGPLVVHGPRAKLPGSDTAAWMAKLAELGKLPVDKVVPGFGSWGGADLLLRQSRFLGELRRQIEYPISMGKSFEFISSNVVVPPSFYVWMPFDTATAADIQYVYKELTVPLAPYNGRPPSKTDTRPHALVLIGDRMHEPEHTEAGLRPVFEATGVVPHFLIDMRGLTAENLAQVKLLVILRDGTSYPEGSRMTMWMTMDQQNAVADFVKGGGGFLCLHNSMGLYPPNGPYYDICGGYYIPHPPIERFRTEVVDANHPITRGVKNFYTGDEQHMPFADTNKVHLLLRNVNDDGARVGPAGWAYEPGQGRLCYLANGHTTESLLEPNMQRLLRNAVNWCLKQKSTE